MGKYNASGFYYDFIKDELLGDASTFKPDRKDRQFYWYFASRLEWDVFQMLRKHIPLTLIKKDEPLEIVKGRGSTENISIIYRPDFTILVPSTRRRYYIECKGFMTEIAKMKMKLLAVNLPAIAKDTHLIFRVSRKMTVLPLIQYHSVYSFPNWLESIL